MSTVIDFSASFPSAQSIKDAGHKGVMLYVSPPREGWMGAKPASREVIESYHAAGIETGLCWQYGGAESPDAMRGAVGGELDARNADNWLREIGLDGWPVFFAVDFDVSLEQWNDTARHYFQAAVDVLGRERVGIYGHSRVVHWAKEDGVVASVAPGRVLGWITRSWQSLNADGSAKGRDYAVLFQGTHNVAGPDGVQIDINEVWHDNWGQRPASEFKQAGPPGMKDWANVMPEKVRIMNKHFTPGRGGRKITHITRHHLAGIGTTEAVWGWWQSRQASAHYVVEVDGTVGQLVWDKDTAWANADQVANQETIAIEHSNSEGAPGWSISETTILNGARLAAALCVFYELGRPVYGVNIRDHREWAATSCPHHLAQGGKYHDQWMSEAQRFYDLLVSGRLSSEGEADQAINEGDLTVDQADRIIEFIKGWTGAHGSDIKDVRQQLTGGRDAGEYPGWPQLGQNEAGQDLTVTDAIAFLRRDVAALSALVESLRNEVRVIKNEGGE